MGTQFFFDGWDGLLRTVLVGILAYSEPTLLLYQSQFLYAAMRSERVSQAKIEAAVRQQSISNPAQVAAVVLKTAGTLSVIQQDDPNKPLPLPGVRLP